MRLPEIITMSQYREDIKGKNKSGLNDERFAARVMTGIGGAIAAAGALVVIGGRRLDHSLGANLEGNSRKMVRLGAIGTIAIGSVVLGTGSWLAGIGLNAERVINNVEKKA